MTHKFVNREVELYLSDIPIAIKNLQQMQVQIEAEKGKDAYLALELDHDDDHQSYARCVVYYKSPETASERKHRLAKAHHTKTAKQAAHKKLYLKLKKEFEGR